MSKTYTTGEKIIAGEKFTIVTLQQATEARIRWNIMRMFCVDAVHLEQMARGAVSCEHCGKSLFTAATALKTSVRNHVSRTEEKFLKPRKLGEIFPVPHRVGEDAYSPVLIWSSDQCVLPLKTVAEKEEEKEDKKKKTGVPPRFDTHQFESFKTLPQLSQYYEYNEDAGRDKKAKGYFVGMLRGTRVLEARWDAPSWVMDKAQLREFCMMQPDPARAVAVLYLYHVCGEPDREISQRLMSSKHATKKYRERLEQAGNAHFGVHEKAA